MGKYQSVTELLENGGAALVLLNAEDLKRTIYEAVFLTKQELEREVAMNNTDVLLSSQEVQERLSISRTTLHNWKLKNFLVPIEIGGKRRYRLSDINEILKKKDPSQAL